MTTKLGHREVHKLKYREYQLPYWDMNVMFPNLLLNILHADHILYQLRVYYSIYNIHYPTQYISEFISLTKKSGRTKFFVMDDMSKEGSDHIQVDRPNMKFDFSSNFVRSENLVQMSQII